MLPDPKDSLKDLKTELFSMNRLVEYLYKHYHPGGKYCRPILVKNLVKEGPFTRKEIYQMTRDAKENDLMVWGFTYKNGHYFTSQFTSDDLFSIALTQKGLNRGL